MTGQDFEVRVLPPRQDDPRWALFAQPADSFGPAPVIEQLPACFDSASNQAPGGFTHDDVQSIEAGTPWLQPDNEDFGAGLNGNGTPEFNVRRMHNAQDHWIWSVRPLGRGLYRLRLDHHDPSTVCRSSKIWSRPLFAKSYQSRWRHHLKAL